MFRVVLAQQSPHPSEKTVLKFYKFPTTEEANWFVQGGLVIRPKITTRDGKPFVEHIVGEDVTFVKPAAATCTFTDAGYDDGLPLLEVIAQLKAAITGLDVRYYNPGRLLLIETTPTNGIEFSNADDEVGKTLLGIQNATDIATTVYGGVGDTAPNVDGFSMDPSNNGVVVLVRTA